MRKPVPKKSGFCASYASNGYMKHVPYIYKYVQFAKERNEETTQESAKKFRLSPLSHTYRGAAPAPVRRDGNM
jgi:hypothetical protein